MHGKRVVDTGIRCGVIAALLAGCSTINTDGSASRAYPLLPPRELQLTQSYALSPVAIVAGVALYLIVDPLAPNWKIEQSEPAPGEFHLALTKKRITAGGGGDGEARQVFLRRVTAIARERNPGPDGRMDYTVLEFTEGVESTLPFSQRVAYGVVKVGREPR